MITIKVDAENPDIKSIRIAADAIKRGELVIIPTETVYGLVADATNEAAVKRIFEAKGRNGKEALPVQVGSIDDLSMAASYIPSEAVLLANRYWPGPLTIILPKNRNISDLVTGSKETVGIRIPDHAVALALLRELGTPIVATSANISGQPPAKNAEQAVADLGPWVSVVLDSGESNLGVASTVIDMSLIPPRILRRGTIGTQEIKEIIGEVEEIGK